MVGIRSFPFEMAYFQVRLLLVSGSVSTNPWLRSKLPLSVQLVGVVTKAKGDTSMGPSSQVVKCFKFFDSFFHEVLGCLDVAGI